MRPLGIPVVKDRIVQTALKLVIEPIFEREFEESSYGFRPGRGCKDALREVDGLIKEGYTHVVDADLESFFDSIPHQALKCRVEERISDGAVHKLVIVSQSGHYRRAEALDAGGRDTARGGDQPASGQYLSASLGPTDETEGISDGALRR